MTSGRRPLLLAAAVVFFVVGVLGWRALPSGHRHLSVGAAVLVLLVLAPLTTLLNGLEFVEVARLVGQRPPLRRALHIAVLGTAANLLPVPGAVLVRVDALRRGGTSVGRSTAASVCAAFFWAAAAALVAGIALLTSQLVLAALLLAASFVLGFGGLTTASRVARVAGGRPGLLGLALVELATVIVGAVRLMVIGSGLGGGIGFGQGAGLGLASIAAAAAGVFPGGLGLREALSAALAPILDLPAAVGAVAATFDRLLGLPAVIAAALVLSRRNSRQ